MTERKHAVEEACIGSAADTSLGPWVDGISALTTQEAGADNQAGFPDRGGCTIEGDSLHNCLVPEDLALDFEAFLNDANLLGGASQGDENVEPFQGTSLFPELFAAS